MQIPDRRSRSTTSTATRSTASLPPVLNPLAVAAGQEPPGATADSSLGLGSLRELELERFRGLG